MSTPDDPPPDDPALDADVMVVGFGPTGATLAGLLARRGLRVVVVDRDTELFPLPRAAQCDHEVLRILQELGCADEVVAATVLNDGLDFVAADRSVLQSFTVPALARTGWPTSVFFHQPSFETVLRRTVADLGAEVRLGVGVGDLRQDAQGVTAELADGTRLRTRYAVGCDGARSATRKVIGTDLRDTGFEESWLVVDLFLHEGATGLPTRCLQVCDPARPHTVVPMPAPRFRFEFMLLPGESAEAISAPASISELLASWLPAGTADVERSAVYTFHGLVASTWRDRRVLLAGDAAHQTPPFLGQGMCAGMRDAANLAWKLAAVVADGAPDELLDTYQAEREPHAQVVIDVAVDFGRLICTTDPVAAAERDAAFRAAPAPRPGDEPPSPIPPLGPGPGVGPLGGDLSAQPHLAGERLDDVVGCGFALCTEEPLDLDSSEATWWQAHGAVLDARTHPELVPLLAGRPACAIRPDRYVLDRGPVADLTERARALLGS
ncbi:MAG: bifunctional 3-(3-hydroxy-phenyl)propionate/3-hydroxycinnamic acid hydroxylase [Actinobacteria bacterium]|nr:bifunctional 3-(3-hydroxy-phenyl)propionate/3-hydroxycinnamic acid hydroxylase [Actinomycetota bacterium]